MQALYYEKNDGQITCLLCPHNCNLQENQCGLCGVREVRQGPLIATNYGQIAALNLDPMEKKPLYHFYPGYPVLSLGTYGCNLFCSFCQNWTLARGRVHGEARLHSPADILRILEQKGGPAKVPGVAYTYNEPAVWYEFVLDTARLLHDHGYVNIMVTNGYISEAPLRELLPFLDAMNIDLKSFDDQFYRRYCRGRLEPVLKTIERSVPETHVEITCLLIPTLNDSPEEQAAMVGWLGELSSDLVLHYSRYFPQHKLELPPTDLQKMLEIRSSAQKVLHYVYLGNVDLPGSADTNCPNCDNLLIQRSAYRVSIRGLEADRCSQCHRQIALILP